MKIKKKVCYYPNAHIVQTGNLKKEDDSLRPIWVTCYILGQQKRYNANSLHTFEP